MKSWKEENFKRKGTYKTGEKLEDNKDIGMAGNIIMVILIIIFIPVFRQESIGLAAWFCRDLSM